MNHKTFQIEVTDTFGGEANYSWVRRFTFTAPPDANNAQLVRLAKKAAQMTGQPCTRTAYGDTIQLDVKGACIRAFITMEENA